MCSNIIKSSAATFPKMWMQIIKRDVKKNNFTIKLSWKNTVIIVAGLLRAFNDSFITQWLLNS